MLIPIAVTEYGYFSGLLIYHISVCFGWILSGGLVQHNALDCPSAPELNEVDDVA